MNNSDLEDTQEFVAVEQNVAEAVIDDVENHVGLGATDQQASDAAALLLRDEATLIFKRYFDNLEGEAITDFYPLFLSEFEPALFEAVMNHTRGNQTKAAAILSVNRGTLRKKLKIYGML